MHASLAVALALLSAGQEQLTWEEFGQVVVERKVSVPLPGNHKVEGEVLAVRPDGMVMDIWKTSDRAAFPRGQGFVPRSSVNTVRVIREKGPMKLVGGIAGTAGGFLAVIAVGFVTNGVGAIPMLLAGWPACGVGGYYLGKAADRRTTLITIRQD
jgi:hypothetical protein